jgi:hypothetical protein
MMDRNLQEAQRHSISGSTVLIILLPWIRRDYSVVIGEGATIALAISPQRLSGLRELIPTYITFHMNLF